MERAKLHTLGMETTSKGKSLRNYSLGNSFWCKKKFCYCWVGFNCENGRCSNINQQFVFTRLSKIAQIALTFWLQEKIVCILNMKEICFEVLYDIRGNSSVLVTFFLLWRASHVDHVTHFLSSNTLISLYKFVV